MRSVLGIDAAWSDNNPSGLALVAERGHGWQLIALANSYENFVARRESSQHLLERPAGSHANIPSLLDACYRRLGQAADVVAVDMPLSLAPITRRRASDDAVSIDYGSRHCSTHSPSRTCPGGVSDDLTQDFGQAGYALQMREVRTKSLIEVYPHPALVELANAPRRLEYKYGKIRKYWPKEIPEDRKKKLLDIWKEIACLLEAEVDGVSTHLPALTVHASGWEFKSWEDRLDAIVCAWVGICALEGRAKPFGDEQSAIWIPTSGGE